MITFIPTAVDLNAIIWHGHNFLPLNEDLKMSLGASCWSCRFSKWKFAFVSYLQNHHSVTLSLLRPPVARGSERDTRVVDVQVEKSWGPGKSREERRKSEMGGGIRNSVRLYLRV